MFIKSVCDRSVITYPKSGGFSRNGHEIRDAARRGKMPHRFFEPPESISKLMVDVQDLG
jgi:hypothetical protein